MAQGGPGVRSRHGTQFHDFQGSDLLDSFCVGAPSIGAPFKLKLATISSNGAVFHYQSDGTAY
jgi:hypothetical protein